MITRFFNNLFNLKDKKIRDQLFLFCRSVDLNQCMNILKEKLKKKNQVEEYDLIYNNFIRKSTLYTNDTIIEDLNRPIKLMVFSMYYRHLLFPERFNHIKLVESKMDWLLTLFDKEYSSFSFLFTACQLSRLYEEKVFDGNFYEGDNYLSNYYTYDETLAEYRIIGSPYVQQINRYELPQNRLCFLYILLHKAGNSSFESIVSFLIDDEKFSKIPLSFKFWITRGEGPHGGEYDNIGDFIEHDYEHVWSMFCNISVYDISEIKNELKQYVKGSLWYKIMIIYTFVYMFETEYKEGSSTNFFDDFVQKFKDIGKRIDSQDFHYILSYLMSSTDIKDEELIFKYMEYKIELEDLMKEHRKIIVKKHGLDEWRQIMYKLKPLYFNFFELFCERNNIV